MSQTKSSFEAMDAELEKIPAQIGTAVLDASDGRIVKVRL